MTHEEHELHHIDLAVEVIDNKLRRLEADKARLLRRRTELLDKKYKRRLF